MVLGGLLVMKRSSSPSLSSSSSSSSCSDLSLIADWWQEQNKRRVTLTLDVVVIANHELESPVNESEVLIVFTLFRCYQLSSSL